MGSSRGFARNMVQEIGVLQGSGKGKHASDRSLTEVWQGNILQ